MTKLKAGILLTIRVTLFTAVGLSGLARLTPAQPNEARRQTDASDEIRVLTIEGVINPFSARYFEREVSSAEDDGAEAVVLNLDTPGGLESSMRRMIQTILGADVPVIVYVQPAGGRAASAGMFITIAGHIAAMAPGTNIGSAHPVALGGGGESETPAEEGEPDPVEAKVINDAAALARNVARERGRNEAWAEEAVRKSVSITDSEAVRRNVVDLVAPELPELLNQIDGRKVRLARGEVTLATADATVTERPMNLAERILHLITDPNIAYLLMTIAFVGIIAELYSPGMFFPGLTGLISFILAFVALGSLPISWAGIFLLALGVGLFIVELQNEGVGVFAVAGLVAFVLGSLMLYQPLTPVSPALPAVSVHPWVIVSVVALIVGFFFIVLRAVTRVRKRPVATGIESLIGATGTAVTDLSPSGRVRISGEEWSAEADSEVIEAGQTVTVVSVSGVRLRVRRSAIPLHGYPTKSSA